MSRTPSIILSPTITLRLDHYINPHTRFGDCPLSPSFLAWEKRRGTATQFSIDTCHGGHKNHFGYVSILHDQNQVEVRLWGMEKPLYFPTTEKAADFLLGLEPEFERRTGERVAKEQATRH